MRPFNAFAGGVCLAFALAETTRGDDVMAAVNAALGILNLTVHLWINDVAHWIARRLD